MQIGKLADLSGEGAPPSGELYIPLVEGGCCSLCGQYHHSEWQDKQCRTDAILFFEKHTRAA